MRATLLVLAAGIGSRYEGLKQLDPVGPNGELIIDYSIFDAARSGFGKVVFVIRKDIEAEFTQKIGNRWARRLPVEYVFQELADLPAGFSVPPGRDKLWGTGQAILAARDVINEPFAVINADDFYGRAGYELIHDFLESESADHGAQYAMVGFVLRNTLSDHGSVARSVCEYDQDYRVRRVSEHVRIFREGTDARSVDDDGNETVLSGNSLVSMNMWGFSPSIFEHLESGFSSFLATQGSELKSEFFIPTVVGGLVEAGAAELKVLESPDTWFGITYREDKAVVIEKIKKLVEAGYYPQHSAIDLKSDRN